MLNHQLDQAQKEILRLKAQLAHRPGTSANPAVLRTATAVRHQNNPQDVWHAELFAVPGTFSHAEAGTVWENHQKRPTHIQMQLDMINKQDV